MTVDVDVMLTVVTVIVGDVVDGTFCWILGDHGRPDVDRVVAVGRYIVVDGDVDGDVVVVDVVDVDVVDCCQVTVTLLLMLVLMLLLVVVDVVDVVDGQLLLAR